MFKKSDKVGAKNNINNNSSKSEDKPDIQVIDQNDGDIICDSDMNAELDIICEPDINIEVNDQESNKIEAIDFSENPDTSKSKTSNDVNSNDEITEESNDVICEPDIDNLESNSEEVTEIEVIKHSKTYTDTKEDIDSKNSNELIDIEENLMDSFPQLITL